MDSLTLKIIVMPMTLFMISTGKICSEKEFEFNWHMIDVKEKEDEGEDLVEEEEVQADSEVVEDLVIVEDAHEAVDQDEKPIIELSLKISHQEHLGRI